MRACALHALTRPPPHTHTQVDDIRGSPLTVGTLEEIIDEK